jgi:spherulation-specific family 4 protein
MRKRSLLRLYAAVLVAFIALMTVLFVLVIRESSGQSMAVPAFFPPGRLWRQLESAAATLSLVVMNPASGPGIAYDPAYGEVVRTAEQRGITVVGYVDTDYGTRDLSAVDSEVDNYYRWYHVDGIFFDRASDDCVLARGAITYYGRLHTYVKAKGGSARIILNPGKQTNECFLADADILVTFEGTDAQYVNGYSAPSWVTHHSPSHFWHIVYDASKVSAMTRAIALSKQRRAGSVYVTPDALPSPYDTLPSGRYWTTELAKLR